MKELKNIQQNKVKNDMVKDMISLIHEFQYILHYKYMKSLIHLHKI